MTDYLDLDLGTLDAEELRQEARDYIQAQAPPGFRINAWMDWVLGAVARMAVLVLTLAGRVPRSIYKDYLVKVLGIQMNAATYANGTVTIAASATQGGTLDAGAQITIGDVGFVTTAAITLAAGASGDVAFQAVRPGSSGSGLSGGALLVAPSVVWVEGLTVDDPTQGGEDGETDDEFVDRGADETPTLTRKMVHIDDVAPLLRDDPEVYRVLVRENFVPPASSGVAGAVTAAPMTATGTPVSTDGKDRLVAKIENGRILAVDAHIVDPTEHAMAVAFTAIARTGSDPAVVEASAKAALQERLSPLGHGIPSGGQPTEFVYDNLIRRLDLIGVLYRVPDLEHVSSLTLALSGDPFDIADITLSGVAPVPTLDLVNIAATVT